MGRENAHRLAGSPDGIPVTVQARLVKLARKVFNQSLRHCHAGGVTKTNQDRWPGSRNLGAGHPFPDSVRCLGGLHEGSHFL